MKSTRSPKRSESGSTTPLATPVSPQRKNMRPSTAGAARTVPTPTGPKTPLRRPVSAVGKAMRKHLNDLWDDTPKARSRSPSPSRIQARLEAEREAAAAQAGFDVQRVPYCTLEGHSQPIRSICLGPGNSVAFTAGMDGSIKVWELEYLLSTQGGECPPQQPIRSLAGHASGVSCITLVDDRYLCSGGWDSDVKVWDVEQDYKCVATLKGHAEFVRAVVGANGLVFSGSNDRTIKVWDLNELQCVGMMTGHSLAVLCLAVAKDKLFSGGYDFMVKVWDIATRSCIADLTGHTQVITSLSLYTRYKISDESAPLPGEGVVPESYTLYSCAEDMTVRIWDLATLSCLGEASLEVPNGTTATGQALPSTECRPWVSCVGNDGWLYIGSREGAVMVWNAKEGRCLSACLGHSSSVRSIAMVHLVPYAESLLLSASDDGTVRVWKSKQLVKREKEGIRLEQERLAKEEARAKRRAKESLELERQRQREELLRAKDQENEVVARQQLVIQAPLGPVAGTDKFDDLPFFEGWLLHKSYVQELTVWSMGHVHGIQVTYNREGKKGSKADKHAHDLGKQMPTANIQQLQEGEEITEVSMIVSEKLIPGVIGQMKIKTTENGADGYKFGRTTDGEELRIVTPAGMRLVSFTGSFSQKGLHQLGCVFVPKMERGRQQGEGKPLTICAKARVSLATPDGRPLYLSDTGMLVVSPTPGNLQRGTVFTLEGSNDEFALSRTKGHYMSLQDSGHIVEEWSARDGFSRKEVFEIAAHATDEGARVTIRAANSKLLAVKQGGSEVKADSLQAVEEELLCVVARNTDVVEGLGPAGRVKFGLRTAEEKEAGWLVEIAERRKTAKARNLRVMLAEAGIHKTSAVATHLFDRRDVRLLTDLPRLLRELEDIPALAGLLRNMHFCAAKVATCGVGAMIADLGAAEVEMARGHPHEMKRRLDASRSGVGSLSEALAIVKSLKAVLSSEAAELQADPKSLFSVLWNKIDSLALPLKAEVNKTKKEGDELLARAAEAAEKVKLDVVHGSQLREQLQTLVDSGIAPVLEGGAKKCNEVMMMVQSKLQSMVVDFEVAIQEFCKVHMPSNKLCSPQAFRRLAETLTRRSGEDVSESFLRVRGAKEEGQAEQAVKDAIIAAASNPPIPEGVSLSIAHFDAATNTALLRFSRVRAPAASPLAGYVDPDHHPPPMMKLGAEDDEERPSRGSSPDRGASASGTESGPGTQRTETSGNKSGRGSSPTPSSGRRGASPPGRRRGHRRHNDILQRADSDGGFQVQSGDKTVIGLRDELMARVLAGGLAPAMTEVVPDPPEMKPAKIFIGGSSMNVMAERAALHAMVLPALRANVGRVGVDLSWVDMHWLGEEGEQPAYEWLDFSPHRALMALQHCWMPTPLGERRRVALLVIGQGCEREVSARELEILKMRAPEVVRQVEAAKLPMSSLEFVLRQLQVGEVHHLDSMFPQSSFELEAPPKPEDVDVKDDENADGAVAKDVPDQRVVNELVCFMRDPSTIRSEDFTTHVPGAVQSIFGVEAEREGQAEREALRGRVEILLRMAEETMPGVIRRYKMALQPAARPGTARVATEGVLWDTVALSGLSEPPEQAEDEEMWGIKMQQLLDQMTFELPAKFSASDIDPNFTYLSNRGSNAVVTYRGERAQLAAALATQKHQIRMATNVKAVMKGPNVPAPGQERAQCDDKDMTLVEVKGIPRTSNEADMIKVLSMALKEVTLYPGTKDEGELSGSIGVTYENSDVANDIRAKLSGVPFKYLRPPRKTDVQLGGVLAIERNESATGSLKVYGLPYNVDTESVQNLFNIAAVPEWSTLRKDRSSAVLAFRHKLAASLIVLRFDRSRPWGGTGEKLTVQLVDPSTATHRVYLSNVPLTLNDKISSDWEKSLKDLLSKEKDLVHAMVHLPAKPIPAHTRVYSRHIGDSSDRRVTYAGDARIGYVHASLGKLALAALQKEENSLAQYGRNVHASLAHSTSTLCSSLRFQSVDRVRLALRAYRTLWGSANRLYPEYPFKVQDLHEIIANDQALTEAEILRQSCVAGFSMSALQLAKLTDFLTEMCALFRGDEAEWLLVDGSLKRHELRHVGDGVRNLAATQAMTAIGEKKGTIVVVYGQSGTGTTSLVARVAHLMKNQAAQQELDEKAKAAAAAKAKTKKKAPARPTAPAVGGAKKDDKKKEEKKVEVAPSTVVVSFYKRPWGTVAELCSYVIREMWKGYKVKDEEGNSLNRELEWARAAIGAAPGKELAVLKEALVALLTANLNVTVGFVFDGLSESEVKAFGAMMQEIKGEIKQNQYKLWCVVSLTVSSEDQEPDELIFPVKLQPMSKPEATAVLYEAVQEMGPHLLQKHIQLFIGIFQKTQCWHPRYLRMLALLVSHQNVFYHLTQDIKAIKDTLPALFTHDILPWLEREFNTAGKEFDPLPKLAQRKDAAASTLQNSSKSADPYTAVEHVLKLLLDAGDDGVYVSDLPSLVPLPDRVLEPLVHVLIPMLSAGYCMGRRKVAMTCPALRAAVTKRYWPSGVYIRGTGCTQLTQPLPPSHSPLRAAFGKQIGSHPVVIIDIVNPYQLDTVKRLLTRLLHELAAQASKGDERKPAFNFFSCSGDCPSLSETMVEVDGSGNNIRAAAEWLARLAPNGNRLEWTAAFELVGTAGFGHDNIFLLSDRSPTLSVERILDEVRHLESELGHEARVVVHCNAIDAEPAADKMLRRISSETGGRLSRLSAFVLRQQLLGETVPPEVLALEETAGCSDPGLLSPIKALVDAGLPSGSLMLEPSRAVSVLIRGEVEDRLTATAATQRGLTLMVLSRDLSEKHNKTYDTWGSADDTTALANVLQGLTTNEVVVLTSFDAWERCFDHQAANALSRCGIDGRRMLQECEVAKASWEALCKKLGTEPSDDCRPEGHGFAVAAIGIPGRKPWGKTQLARDLGAHSPPSEISVSLAEIAQARKVVESKESEFENQGRIVGVCKVVTPFRWSHEAGAGQGYNILPGHSYAVPTKDGNDRSLSSVLASSSA